HCPHPPSSQPLIGQVCARRFPRTAERSSAADEPIWIGQELRTIRAPACGVARDQPHPKAWRDHVRATTTLGIAALLLALVVGVWAMTYGKTSLSDEQASKAGMVDPVDMMKKKKDL